MNYLQKAEQFTEIKEEQNDLIIGGTRLLYEFGRWLDDQTLQEKLPDKLEKVECSKLMRGNQELASYLTSKGAEDIIKKINQILDYLKSK